MLHVAQVCNLVIAGTCSCCWLSVRYGLLYHNITKKVLTKSKMKTLCLTTNKYLIFQAFWFTVVTLCALKTFTDKFATFMGIKCSIWTLDRVRILF